LKYESRDARKRDVVDEILKETEPNDRAPG
jgi:hypothetical protein